MCGIAGFYSLSNDQNVDEGRKIARKMGKAIAHRGPDSHDIWQDPDLSLALIHQRLAIIDLSPGGKQPMHSANGRYVITFNGEIYNYLELQATLEAAGCEFKSRSDTEVMLVAFEYWGLNLALQKINGMFAFALWDRQERKLHLVRDRFGKKPLYIGWAGNNLVFGSELKALHAHPDFKPEINRNALALYMNYGYVHAPYSIFDGVWQLLPASRMTLDLQNLKSGDDLAVRMELYWSLKNTAEEGLAKQSRKSEGQIIDEFEGLLEKAVAQRMVSDVPLGAFLSGGIDSSTIVALMQKQAAVPVKTFSIGFEQEGFNEAEHAKRIAEHLNTDHHEFYVSGKDALDVIPNLADIYDEPFADSSQVPTYLISKMARQEVTVALSGDGGDEILGGYDRHTQIAPLWSKVGWMPQFMRRMGGKALQGLPDSFYEGLRPNNPNFPAQVRRAIDLMGLKNADEIYAHLIKVWPNGAELVKGGRLPLVPLKNLANWPQGMSFADKMMFGDTLSYRSDDLMVKTDRASMATALEVRAPLMDYRLAEYSWGLPMKMKIRNGQGKWILRQILKRHVPPRLYNRPKMGFSVPLNEWLRGPLREWGDDLLAKDRLEAQGLLDADKISQSWIDFQENQGFQGAPKHLWSALMFQAWHDRWMK